MLSDNPSVDTINILSSMYYLYKVFSDLPSVDTINILSSMYYLYKVLSDLPSVDIINSTCYVLDIDWALIKNSLNLETGHDQTALLS